MPDDQDTQTKTKRSKAKSPDEPSAVIDAEPGAVDAAVDKLGDAVRANEGATGGYDLSEGAHTSAIEQSERMATDWVLDRSSLISGGRDFLLEQFKRRTKPWSVLSQAEQRDVAAAAEHAASELVRKTVEAIASNGRQSVRVFLQKITMGEKIQITGEVRPVPDEDPDAAVLLLHHSRGKFVILTVASKDDFNQNEREPEIDDDEPPLNFEAGTGEIDEEPDLAEAGGEAKVPTEQLATGDMVSVPGYLGASEVRVNVQTGMIEAKAAERDEYDIDVRQATPAELAAERERTADFDDEVPGGAKQAADA